jgi:hypothetical protein
MRTNRFKRKRAIWVTALVVLSFAISAAAAGLTTTSWWTADGHSTDIVSLHDAELQGDAAFASGVHSKAFSLPSANSSIKLPAVAADGLEDFTFEGWVYTKKNTGTVISGAKSNAATNEMSLSFDLNNITVYLKGTSAIIPLPEPLRLKKFYHVAWTRQASGFNAIYLNSIQIGTAILPTGALEIAAGGLWLGQKQFAVGSFITGDNCLCRLDETTLHDDDLDQTQLNRRYRMTRRLKELEREGLQTDVVSTKLDDVESLLNARLDALEVQLAANQNALLNQLADNQNELLEDLEAINDFIFDTHLVDELDMEITACLNLGGSAGFKIEPGASSDAEVLGTVGVDAYGNGALMTPRAKAQLGFGFEAGAEVGIEVTACLGGIVVRQTDVTGAGADLRNAVDDLAQDLGLTTSNLNSAIGELASITISTDPTDLLNGPPDIINVLPLPGNVKSVFNDISDIVPTSLADLDPCVSPLAHLQPLLAQSAASPTCRWRL